MSGPLWLPAVFAAALAAQPPASAPGAPAPGADPAVTTSVPDQAPPAAQATGLVLPVPDDQFAELRFSNRHIVTFRAAVVPRSPKARVESAARALERFANDNVTGPVGSRTVMGATVVTVAGQDVFGITQADVDPALDSLPGLTAMVVDRVRVALAEAAEARTPTRLARGFGRSALATLFLVLLLTAVVRARRWVTGRLILSASERLARSRMGRDLTFLRASRLLDVGRGLVRLGAWAIALVAVYAWVSFVLQQFPLTRPWGEALGGFLVSQLTVLGLGALAALPGLFTAALIFLAARFLVRLSNLLFTAVEQGRIELFGLDAPKAPPTRRLVATLVWVFAVVVAYPYLPGSNTDAFKGVSVFIGLMVSLGSSGIVNHVMSGFMLTYSGALAPGDYARVGDVEGVVTGLGVLSTKVKTIRNEEVTIPNAVVISGTTVNYARYAADGVYARTVVTIGYDAPWRQVEAMLRKAAARTPGVRSDRDPVVLQTNLSDFYVEYTLHVCLEHPGRRVQVLAALHARIQDVFNEHGVQIMSPHYEKDPPEPKVVARQHWYDLPAEPDPPKVS